MGSRGTGQSLGVLVECKRVTLARETLNARDEEEGRPRAAALMAWRATRTAWSRSGSSRRDFLKKMRLAEHPFEFDHTERRVSYYTPGREFRDKVTQKT